MIKKILIISLFVILLINSQKVLAKSGGLRVTPRNIDDLKKAMELRRENFKKDLEKMDEVRSGIYKKQNRLREAAQNLMIMEKMIQDDGEKVAEIAEFLNDSSKKTIEFEEEFRRRKAYLKFFFGQKEKTVERFSKTLEERKTKIEELKKLILSSESTSDIKKISEEELGSIEEEQGRIESFFNEETKRKGILTWLVNIFK